MREKLPDERRSITKKFKLGSLKFYATVGLYNDGRPGEIFIHADKVGSLERGLLSMLSLTMSLALQHGVPLEALVEKYRNSNFEPSGFVGEQKIRLASSVVDYLAQWLDSTFLKKEGSATDEGSGLDLLYEE